MTTKTKPVRKSAPKSEAPVQEQQAETPAAATPKAAKPTIELYGFKSGWTGESDVTNARISRTKIDAGRFNLYPKGNVTQRDQDAMVALRSQFGGKQFERRNCDAGILRRLMERGLARPVQNNDTNAPTSKFTLTKAGLGQQVEAKAA